SSHRGGPGLAPAPGPRRTDPGNDTPRGSADSGVTTGAGLPAPTLPASPGPATTNTYSRFRALAGHRLTARPRTTGCWTQDTLSVLVGSPDSVHRWTESGSRSACRAPGRGHAARTAAERQRVIAAVRCDQPSRNASGSRSAWAA